MNFGTGSEINEFNHTLIMFKAIQEMNEELGTNSTRVGYEHYQEITAETSFERERFAHTIACEFYDYGDCDNIQANAPDTKQAPTMPRFFYRGELIAYPENIIVRDVTIKACMSRLQEFARVLELPAIMQVKNIRHDEVVFQSIGYSTYA